METLDLHGVRHEKVSLLVENFVLVHPMPVRIITGQSHAMLELVIEVLKKYNFKWENETYWNLGSLLIKD